MKSKTFDKQIGKTLHIVFFAVLGFFSIIVKTKLQSYSYIIAPIGILYISVFLTSLFNKYPSSTWKKWALMSVLLFVMMNPVKSYVDRFIKSTGRSNRIYNTEVYKNVGQKIPKGIKTLININTFEDIDVMFYNNDINAYQFWFDVKLLDSLAKQKIHFAAFKTHGKSKLPPEYNSYPYLHILSDSLR